MKEMIMAQNLPDFCPRCGTPTTAGQRSCAHCGLTLPISSGKTHDDVSQVPMQTHLSVPPSPLPLTEQDFEPEEPFIQPPKPRKMGRGSFIVMLLLILLLLGAGCYVSAQLTGIHLPGLGGNTQSLITTTQINTLVTYAGVDVTVLTVQQAENFVDDAHTTTTGMVRLNMQEQNKTSTLVSWNYENVAHLVLPGKKVVAPTLVQAKDSVAPGITQHSKIDFAVPTAIHINQLILRLGASNEAQMDIPLTGHADLSKYAPHTVKLSGTTSYVGLDWTLVSATTQFSVVGQQASKNMLYLVLTLSVDNSLSQQAIPGSAYDYLRLQANNTTFEPKDTTLPVSFDTGATGKTGTVTFLAPQGTTAFTLMFRAQGGSDAASIDFQLA
jgi:hypothetical protein